MKTYKFQDLNENFKKSFVASTLAQLEVRNESLLNQFNAVFCKSAEGGLFGDTIFESMFPWKQSDTAMKDIPSSVLSGEFVKKLSAVEPENLRIPLDRRPYEHQLKAWEELRKEGQSVLVTSGTGSGKTECFLIPILNDIYEKSLRGGKEAEGVQALFIYPLNALIESQKERMEAWCRALVKNKRASVRFGLYTGQMPESGMDFKPDSVEVPDRTKLRETPPQLLVTNPTMLEYMLIRRQDEAILKASEGKLSWIVIDEAHNYLGSSAAELSLLLRRVIISFKTDPKNVHFIATSATIGSERDLEKLRSFLAGLAGVPESQVSVVRGFRDDTLPPSSVTPNALTLSELEEKKDAPGFSDLVFGNRTALELREFFRSNGRCTEQELTKFLAKKGSKKDSNAAARWLDVASLARYPNGDPFLPVRAHLFSRTVSGLWACTDAKCRCRQKELSPEDWHFGRVYFEERKKCECGAMVFPVVACRETGDVALKGVSRIRNGDGRRILKPFSFIAGDEEDFEIDGGSTDLSGKEDFYLWNVKGPTSYEDHSVNITDFRYVKGAESAVLCEFGEEIEGVDESGIVTCYSQDGFDDNVACPVCRQQYDAGEGGKELLSRHLKGLFTGMGRLFSDTTPVVLKFCPPAKEHPQEFPYEGRRFIAFADSRQGSARSAAILEYKGYKAFVQAVLLQALTHSASNPLTEAQSGQLQLLQSMADTNSLPASMRLLYEELTKKQSEVVAKISWDDAKAWLSRELQNQTEILRSFPGLSEDELAEILLFREFWSHRTRWGSLETDGFVRVAYKAVDDWAKKFRHPAFWTLSDEDWIRFLEICVNYIVRENMVIAVDRDRWLKFGGYRLAVPKVITADRNKDFRFDLVRWPRVDGSRRRSHVVIRYLADLLGLKTDKHADALNTVMDKAFEDIVRSGWLQARGPNEYSLSFEKQVFFVLNSGRTSYCPAKHWAVYHPINGRSPWMSGRDELSLIEYRVPALKKAGGSGEGILLEDAGDIEKMRTFGVWQSNYDSFADGITYFKAVEHSAQQDKFTLREYESLFKEHKINVMSCSTTMEMGVDIGGINSVVLTNVPPHPANYLQRVGRAGRRQEAEALSMTICRNVPHDHHIFKSTDWAFTQPIPVPQIRLDSEPIMRRHINALLLSYYLKTVAQVADIAEINVQEWLRKDKDHMSMSSYFSGWLASLISDKEGFRRVAELVSHLLRGSPFRAEMIPGFLKDSALEVQEIGEKVSRSLEASYSQMRDYDGRNSRAYKAIEQQVRKVQRENIVRWLSRELYLPVHGFPVGTVVFDPLLVDKKFERRDLPSREAAVGIREYAPGSTVVIDGTVYRSEGIIVDWKYDKDPKVRTRKSLYICRECGGFDVVSFGDTPKECPSCHADWSAADSGGKNAAYTRREFLEPKGYTVAGNAKPSKDFSEKVNLPYRRPLISPKGEWRPLNNPSLGVYRTTNRGSLYYYDNGIHERGYAVCLSCGRASPMGANGEMPPWTKKKHKKLLADDDGRDCKAVPYSTAILPCTNFGRNYLTDIFQLILFKEKAPESLFDQPGAGCSAYDLCYTTALALRRLAARRLCIREEELGCDALKVGYEGRDVYSVVIYDINNAGYSCLIGDFIEDLLKDKDLFGCPGNCEDACEQCLLTFDSRVDADHIQRRKTKAVFTAEWLAALKLDAADKIFGAGTEKEKQNLMGGILREAFSNAEAKLYLYLRGDAGEWSIAGSQFFDFVSGLRKDKGLPVTIVIEPDNWKRISAGEAEALKYYTDFLGAGVALGSPPSTKKEGFVLATLEGERCVSWGVLKEEGTKLDASWGEWSGLLVYGQSSGPKLSKRELKWPKSTALQNGQFASVTNEFDSEIWTLPQKFWTYIGENLLQGRELPGDIASVVYRDRYIATPFMGAVILYILQGLKNGGLKGATWTGETKAVIQTVECRDAEREGARWTDNWTNEELRCGTMTQAAALMQVPLFYQVESSRQAVEHARTLEVVFTNGRKIEIWLDQGFGFLIPGTRDMGRQQYWISWSDRNAEALAQKISKCGYSVFAPDPGTRIAASFS
jgi:superfamily II DNA/RNA helicase